MGTSLHENEPSFLDRAIDIALLIPATLMAVGGLIYFSVIETLFHSKQQ